MKPHAQTVRDIGFAMRALRQVAEELAELEFDVGEIEANIGDARMQNAPVTQLGFTAEAGTGLLRHVSQVYLSQVLSDKGRPTFKLCLSANRVGVMPYQFPASSYGASDLVTAIHTQVTAAFEFQSGFAAISQSGLITPQTPVLELAS